MNRIFHPVTLVALLAIFLLAGFTGGQHNAFDRAIVDLLGEVRQEHPKFVSFTVIVTQLGSVYATLGLGFAAALLLAWKRKFRVAALLALTVAGERLALDGLKLAIGRPRPWFDENLVVTHSTSFPSGHSANTMAVFVAVALIAVPARHRSAAFISAIAASLVIGATRPFLGVHWPTDVIGGWSFGLLIALLAVVVGRRSAILADEAEHQIVGRHRPPVRQHEAS
ncbi:phosphatase PAP2 family protein [Sphingomonas edaphi]|uniref:PAP2 family protein n=1 Tax=Sphingomonas edaphi TaxID=2315689 RepID=A0A418PZ64_9SPHN|nr:phosphatase PAP2 family protein [Sphingomonas edaphi]RIX27329.1 PAP2 family protein [Sphingomonas edaphi]